MEKIKETFSSESDQGLRSIPEEETIGLIPEDLNQLNLLMNLLPNPIYRKFLKAAHQAPGGIFEEIQIGKFKVRLHLPPQFVEQALSSNREDRLKMAGQAAVHAIKKFSQLTSSPPHDPVSTWSELRSIILKRLDPSESEMAV